MIDLRCSDFSGFSFDRISKSKSLVNPVSHSLSILRNIEAIFSYES